MSSSHACKAGGGPRIGLWGTFDVDNYGDLLFPRIFAREIRRRLPQADVVPYSPRGPLHPVTMDGALPALPLGRWDDAGRRALAKELDFVAVGGGELLHTWDEAYRIYYGMSEEEIAHHPPSRFFIDGLGPELEASCPVAWHCLGAPFPFTAAEHDRVRSALEHRAYLSVRDEETRRRLWATGYAGDIRLVPDSGLLLDQIFAPELLARRLHYLRSVDAYPTHAAPIVLQGSANLLPYVSPIAAAVEELRAEQGWPPVVLLPIGPCHGDGRFLDAMAPLLSAPLHRIPDQLAVEDVAAAIAQARSFVGLSLHGAITALVYGVPFALLNLVGYSKLDGFAKLVSQEDTLATSTNDIARALRCALQAGRSDSLAAARERLLPQLHRHFDQLAELAENAWEARLGGDQLRATALARRIEAAREREILWEHAWLAQRQRLLAERLRSRELEAASGPLTEAHVDTVQLRERLELEAVLRSRAEVERDRLAAELATAEASQARLAQRVAALEHEVAHGKRRS